MSAENRILQNSESSERIQLLEDIANAFNSLKLPEDRLHVQTAETLKIINLYQGEEQLNALRVIAEVYQQCTLGWSTLKITRLNYTLREPITVARKQVYEFVEEKGRAPIANELRKICRNELVNGLNCSTDSHSNKPIVPKGYKGLTPAQRSVKYRQSDRDI